MKLFLDTDPSSSTSRGTRDRARDSARASARESARDKPTHTPTDVGIVATCPVDFEMGVVGEDTVGGEDQHEGDNNSTHNPNTSTHIPLTHFTIFFHTTLSHHP